VQQLEIVAIVKEFTYFPQRLAARKDGKIKDTNMTYEALKTQQKDLVARMVFARKQNDVYEVESLRYAIKQVNKKLREVQKKNNYFLKPWQSTK